MILVMAQALVCPEVAVDDVCLGLPSNRGHDAHGNIARDSHYVEVSCSDYKDVVDDSRAVDKDDVDDDKEEVVEEDHYNKNVVAEVHAHDLVVGAEVLDKGYGDPSGMAEVAEVVEVDECQESCGCMMLF